MKLTIVTRATFVRDHRNCSASIIAGVDNVDLELSFSETTMLPISGLRVSGPAYQTIQGDYFMTDLL